MSESQLDRLDAKLKRLQDRIDAEAKAKRPLTTEQFQAANHKLPDGTVKQEKAKPVTRVELIENW